MLQTIEDLEANMVFANDEDTISGVVQIHVTLSAEDFRLLPKEKLTEEYLRTRVRQDMVKFLYGELIEDIKNLRDDLDNGDERVDALYTCVDPLDAILRKLGVEE